MTSQQNGGLKPSRRTLVKGAAWSVPVVAIAAPAQAVGCSVDPTPCLEQCLDFSATGSNIRRPNMNAYSVGFLITTNCPPDTVPPTGTVNLTIINEAGAPLSDYCSHAPVTLTITVPAPGESVSIPETIYWASSMAQRIYFYYNGVEVGYVDAGPNDNSMEVPDCPDGNNGQSEAAGEFDDQQAATEASSSKAEATSEGVVVPDLIGKEAAEAGVVLASVGLTMDPSAVFGEITDQDPVAGTVVSPGSLVKVTVTAAAAKAEDGAELATLPGDQVAPQDTTDTPTDTPVTDSAPVDE